MELKVNIYIKHLSRIELYQPTALFTVFFALLGFTYNVWRIKVTEGNSNIRTASFEIFLIYSAHYNGDQREGSPGKS